MSKDTVGKLSSSLLPKQVDDTHNSHDQMLEQLSDYDKNIFDCVDANKKYFPSDFYVVVTIKRERLLTNVLRNYFLARHSCPTPEYDQVVYRYNHKDESITFLWVVPSKETCSFMITNALSIPKSEHDLLNFVSRFMNGDLLKEAKRLNREEPDSPLIIER